ncbi:predicted protein [Aspergillus terreus NIH2624]|uniref:Uncharacterized protein n=1 Tax=Aspergillus terreus (strain NIH 2624 / FGSC A1156) TaxID=341663 RepID=Q0C7T3_ASPTN|nr:uncharacterized protein ATEG_10251 [Aspergillus terreus NIH2624]EAU29248.1 predicted protein [Aspergillus terreus NIH2624]
MGPVTLTKWNKHWPGGIPSFPHRNEEQVEDVAAASRAWRFFLREQWVDVEDVAAEEQRRTLIVRWATADQAFRDNYETRAPEDGREFEDPNDDACLTGLIQRLDDVHICLTKWTPETQALLAKCLITLFGWMGDQEYMTTTMSMYYPLEDNQGNILDTFKFRQSLARPDFLDMCVTVKGTLRFSDFFPKLIIDDRTLETGLCLWVQYQNNGRQERAWRAQMFMDEFPLFFLAVHANSELLDEVLEYMENDRLEDEDPEVILEEKPVDMRRPFVEIFENNRRDDVDRYALGFREAEAAGNGLAIGYELERILADTGAPLKINQK